MRKRERETRTKIFCTPKSRSKSQEFQLVELQWASQINYLYTLHVIVGTNLVVCLSLRVFSCVMRLRVYVSIYIYCERLSNYLKTCVLGVCMRVRMSVCQCVYV